MSIGTSKLAGMPQDHREKLENCVKLLLLWVAASDGRLDEAELEFISSQFPDRAGTITNDDGANAVLSVSQQGSETGPTTIIYTVTLSRQNDTGAAITLRGEARASETFQKLRVGLGQLSHFGDRINALLRRACGF